MKVCYSYTFTSAILLFFSAGFHVAIARNLRSNFTSVPHAAASIVNIDKYYDVVIIGAGWAGVAAANMLNNKNKTNITVLEARSYVGGRSVTSFALGSDIPVDLGSAWVHGITNNPVQALVNKYGVKSSVAAYSEEVYFSNSTRLSDSLIDQLYYSYWEGSGGFMPYEAGKQSSTTVDQSMSNTADGYISLKKLNALQKREFDWLANDNIVQEYAADLSQLSTWWWDNDSALSGDDTFLGVVGGGYSAVINSFASAIAPYIQLNSTVTMVDYSSARVLVTYYNKMGVVKTISASKVIVTLPLGVLKAGTVTFNPLFSKADTTGVGLAKQTAITNLGMGVMNKCALYWKNMTANQVFWPKDREWIEQIADTGAQSNWTLWYNPYAMNGNKPVLIGFVSGNFAERIENLTDAQITGQAVTALRKLFNATKATIPDPSASLITRWKSDIFSLGSYSFQKLGSKKLSRQHLAAPLNNKLFFAGEATHSQYPSTTHGALLSGETAACAVLKLLGTSC